MAKLTDEQIIEYAENNQRLIHHVVKGFSTSNILYDDLVGFGEIGFVKALKQYDTDKKTKFSTYAIHCIRNEILFNLRKENRHIRSTISINTILSTDKNGNDLKLEDIISKEQDDKSESLEDALLKDETRELLNEIISSLLPIERVIIENRYGLNTQNKKTQKELADEVDMSQANISKIEKRALYKMKKILDKRMRINGLDKDDLV